MNILDVSETTAKAVEDAIFFGVGVVVVRNHPERGIEFAHVARDQYEPLIEALRWQQNENKGKMQ